MLLCLALMLLAFINGHPAIMAPQESGTDSSQNTHLWSFHSNASISHSPIVADINNDGRLEAVVCTDTGEVYALSGENGSVMWNSSTNTVVRGSPFFVDPGGGSYPEILVWGENKTAMLNAEDGKMIWQSNEEAWQKPILADIDRNGDYEVILMSSILSVLNARNGSPLWNSTFGWNSTFSGAFAVGDVWGNISLEIVVTNGKKLAVLEGMNGTLVWSNTGSYGPLVYLANVDSDPNSEIVLYASSVGGPEALNGENGSVIWTSTDAGTLKSLVYDSHPQILCQTRTGLCMVSGANGTVIWSSSTSIYSSFLAGYLNGDKVEDFLTVPIHPIPSITAIDGATGAVMWTFSDIPNDRYYYPYPVFHDFNSDGIREVLVAGGVNPHNGADELFILDGEYGLIDFQKDLPNQVYATPVTADLNGDNVSDILLAYTIGDVSADTIQGFSRNVGLHPIIPVYIPPVLVLFIVAAVAVYGFRQRRKSSADGNQGSGPVGGGLTGWAAHLRPWSPRAGSNQYRV